MNVQYTCAGVTYTPLVASAGMTHLGGCGEASAVCDSASCQFSPMSFTLAEITRWKHPLHPSSSGLASHTFSESYT